MWKTCLAAVVGALTALPPGAVGAQTKIRFSYELPVTHNFNKGAEMLRDLVDKKTNGAVKIELYPAAQLAKDSTFIKTITAGSIDGGLIPTLYWTGVMPLAGVFDVPFAITTHDEAQKVLAGPVGAKLLAELDRFELVGLGYFNYGFGIYGNNKRPLKTPADFAGLKIRTNNDIGAKLLQAYGASPVFMSGSEVFLGLERGTVDGAHLGLTSIVERKLYQAVKHLTIDNHNAIPYFVTVRKEIFAKLTSEQQKAIRDAANEVAAWVAKEQEKDDSKSVALLREKGMQVIELTPAEIKAWQDAAKSVKEFWLQKAGDAGKQLLAEIDAALAKK